jgi:hypothetical protein
MLDEQASLKQRYQEDTLFIKQNDPQSAYAVYILYNNHAYGPITIMSLLKQVTKLEFLKNNFTSIYTVPEQNKGENNPMYKLIFDLLITSPPSPHHHPQLYGKTSDIHCAPLTLFSGLNPSKLFPISQT